MLKSLVACFKDCLQSDSKMNKDQLDFPRVELHLHLDGSVRHSTILELAMAKGIDLKGARTVEEVKQVLCTHQPCNLAKVLAAFEIFMPCIVGDRDAIERIAFELCEDQSKNNVIYFEVRYSPHLLSNMTSNEWMPDKEINPVLHPSEVIEAVNRGLARGQKQFNVKSNSILCCIEGYEAYNEEVLSLATEFKDKGVVAVDVAGCAHGADEKYEPSVISIFQEAEKRGIHRTAHAGESGGPNSVVMAVEVLKATRIGHGYRLLWDEAAYKKYALPGKIHFEGCPYSSIMTGACKPDWNEHPMIRWARDGINFSISTDDPTCFDNCMQSEMELASLQLGLTVEQLKKCQLNAANASFLPDNEKAELVKRIQQSI